MKNNMEVDTVSSSIITDLYKRSVCKEEKESYNISIPRHIHLDPFEYSPLSSRCSPMFKSFNHSESKSIPDIVNSMEKSYESSAKSSKSQKAHSKLLFLEDLLPRDLSTDYKIDFFNSQASNSSATEEVVKVTNASTLDLACVVPVIPPHINDYPEVIQSQIAVQLHSRDPIFHDSIQLRCDRKKLINALTITSLMNEDIRRDNWRSTAVESLSSVLVQTLPVIILPLATEDSVIQTDIKESGEVKFEDLEPKSTDISQTKVIDSKTNAETQDQETQAPPLPRAQRKGTNSDITTFSKEKERVDLPQELSKKNTRSDFEDKTNTEVFWGDVYNDYKTASIDETANTSRRKKFDRTYCFKLSVKPNKTGIVAASTGGDVRNLLCIPKQDRDKNLLSARPDLPSHSAKLRSRIKNNRSSAKSAEEEDYAEGNERFQKFFELHQFDEMVKSYLNSTDRRIKSVCSKIGCDIKMFGPIVRCQPEAQKQVPSILYTKKFYYVAISADTKERLEKSVKCVQETFPKTCLSEKVSNQPFMEMCGDEIPI